MRRGKNSSLVIAAVLGVLALCGAIRAGDLTDGLIAHWRFEGNAEDASSYANHGNVHGAILTDGVIGQGYQFDSRSDNDEDYINIPFTNGDELDFSNKSAITTSFWLNLDEIPSNNDGGSRPLYWEDRATIDGDEKLEWFARDNGDGTYRLGWIVYTNQSAQVVRCNNILYGQWHMFTGTYDNNENKIYMDGVICQSLALSGNIKPTASGNDWIISDATEDKKRGIVGKMDEVRIYDRALSAEEVWQVCQEGVGELVDLEIVGPNEVAEDFQTQYKAIAHYDNGSSKDVTASADWSVEPNDIADIDAGLLETEEIDKPQNITITAEYTEGQNTQVAQKQVSILTICPSGSALDFDGVNDYVEVPDNDGSLDIIDSLTLSAWVNLNNIERDNFIANKQPSGTWRTNYPGNYEFKIGEGSLVLAHQTGTGDLEYSFYFSTSGIEAGTWYHVAVTLFEGGDVNFYINGSPAGTSPQSGTFGVLNDEPVRIGTRKDTWSYLDGLADDIRIYDRALSAEEIQASMHTKLAGDEDGLVAYWDFDEGEGEVAGDSSVNSNDGVVSGAEWTDSVPPVGKCIPVAIDIKPGGCPNPLNLKSQGVLPVAILGSEDFDVGTIDAVSVELAGVGAIRHSYEDVAAPVTDGEECECTEDGPDGYTDLTLKFRTQEIIEELIGQPGELEKGQTLVLTLTGELFDGAGIEGADCIVLVGNVLRHLLARECDINEDGVVNMLDFAELATYWLESCEME